MVSLVLASALYLMTGNVLLAQSEVPPGAIQQAVEDHEWREAPASMPSGTMVLPLEGNIREEGLFTLRLRVPAGTRLEPHFHPKDERVTVLSGVVRVGFGENWEDGLMVEYAAGSFYLNPAESAHFVEIVEDCEIQLTGEGPWEIHYLEDH